MSLNIIENYAGIIIIPAGKSFGTVRVTFTYSYTSIESKQYFRSARLIIIIITYYK